MEKNRFLSGLWFPSTANGYVLTGHSVVYMITYLNGHQKKKKMYVIKRKYKLHKKYRNIYFGFLIMLYHLEQKKSIFIFSY